MLEVEPRVHQNSEIVPPTVLYLSHIMAFYPDSLPDLLDRTYIVRISRHPESMKDVH
jgi:hypothetical protein